MTKEDLKVNDIISVNYWHYYGTAVDFYKVSKICAKTVSLIPLEEKYIYHSWGGDESTSIPGKKLQNVRKDIPSGLLMESQKLESMKPQNGTGNR